ncbi:uncharacterized protein LOC113549788 isoform X2 [Rhopalosiphum maidis]|uniref:uncharacterized protein LOC113549788 isoform X2 n=1 Tax=Rhopalosiphum maidis TaxID=43146 RepID=UPI000EFF9AE3|nr:uncharacterized protein LOC113549788 isoform X2 [Rhopalosiphum maidis]
MYNMSLKEKAICLICQESIAVRVQFKATLLYQTAAKYDMIQGQLRIDKLALLMKNIQDFNINTYFDGQTFWIWNLVIAWP